ncbi:malonyl-CoA decarboxylase domain-containing protein [Marinomonas primoryensis]|jgi:malonyl-CoA decarboxylase|uniref:malonyl-CoA decarboxylase domain-containing protein n=1 Tax=Marinomonas primoryensis TaxID=178399 RepID=UPI0030DCC863|tara:strand:- start:10112 stop:11374 length:1263 start_codon:yes stop_codon:yes gene_type:complete
MSMMMELLNSIFDRRYRPLAKDKAEDSSIITLADKLIGTAGESSGITLATQVLDRFDTLNDVDKLAFFHHLADNMDIDYIVVEKALGAYKEQPSKKTYFDYMAAAEPRRQELIRRLNQVVGATGKLVNMRADLLRLKEKSDTLAALDLDFRHLFVSWFNRGFLVLRPINWETPAHILEKIIAYEAVHAIDSWDDLRRRMQPEDRCCFAFFHLSMPDEPLIFVEVALTQGIANSVQSVLSDNRQEISVDEADTAVFYSISNCQQGLNSISFGNSLIKQVVADLSSRFSNLKSFVTLSPIPSLKTWIQKKGINTTQAPFSDMRSLAAHYLLNEKSQNGKPLDPVARFHLGNGAKIHAIHNDADLSTKGLSQSGGAMVNYLYELKHVSENHEKFAATGCISAGQDIHKLGEHLSPLLREKNNV